MESSIRRQYREHGVVATGGQFIPELEPSNLSPLDEALRIRALQCVETITQASPHSIVRERDGAIRACYGVHRQFPAFAEVAAAPELLSVVEHLVGEPVDIYQSHLNIKLRRTGGPYAYHRDAHYFQSRDGLDDIESVVGIGIAITPIDELMGPLVTLLGSHHQYLRLSTNISYRTSDSLRHDDQSADVGIVQSHEISEESITGDHVLVSANGGDCVFFDPRCIHGSAANMSSRTRAMLLLFFAPRRVFPPTRTSGNPYLHEVSA